MSDHPVVLMPLCLAAQPVVGVHCLEAKKLAYAKQWWQELANINDGKLELQDVTGKGVSGDVLRYIQQRRDVLPVDIVTAHDAHVKSKGRNPFIRPHLASWANFRVVAMGPNWKAIERAAHFGIALAIFATKSSTFTTGSQLFSSVRVDLSRLYLECRVAAEMACSVTAAEEQGAEVAVAFDLPADKDDVEIGEVINSRGEDATLEAIFEELRGKLAIARTTDVKDEDFETVRVPVDALRFTQWGCSDRFRCGTPVSEAVDLFVKGSNPADLPWCMLRVIRRNGLLLSVDNRRLFAMKEAQRRIRELDPARALYVRVQIYTWLPIFDKFLQHLDHTCATSHGQSIVLRATKRRRAD